MRSRYTFILSSKSPRTLLITAIQVIFDAQNSHRRKSSLVTAETPGRLTQRRKNTECYVHALLESQRKHGGNLGSGLEHIDEAVAGRKLASESGSTTKTHTPGDSKGGGKNKVLGQEDEVSWQERLAAKGDRSSDAADDGQMMDVAAAGEHVIHSRLLTKKQLSDMAWGVRELSKRLGSVRMKLKVKNVFLLTKAHDETLIAKARAVAKWLLSPEREVRYTVYVEDNLKMNKKFDTKGLLDELEQAYAEDEDVIANGDGRKKLDRRLRFWSNEMCRTRPHTFDFVVTLGGDGTVLYASWLFQRIVPPVLSFALGSLGFLTKFDYEEFEETLTKSFRDGVMISLRLRFEGTVMRSQKRKKTSIENGDDEEDENSNESRDLVEELVGEEKEDERTHRPDGTYEILNDIVVDRGPNPSKSYSYESGFTC
jgi:NAD+ kinase